MARCHFADGTHDHQGWKSAANIANNHSWTAENGLYSGMRIVESKISRRKEIKRSQEIDWVHY